MPRRKRPQRTGSVRKLPSGKFQARVSDPLTGRQVGIGTFDTRDDAEDAIARARSEQAQGLWTGTGKSTVAAALALSLAQSGRRVMLMEVEGRQGLAQLFDTPPMPYEERKLASAPGGGEVWGLAVDPEEALLEYLELFYNLRRAGGVLRRMGAMEFVTTIAPGLRDRKSVV